MTELLNEGMTKEEILNVLIEAMETGQKVDVTYAGGQHRSMNPAGVMNIEQAGGGMCVVYGKSEVTSVSFTDSPFLVKPGTTFRLKGEGGGALQTLIYVADEIGYVYGFNSCRDTAHYLLTSIPVDLLCDMRIDIRKVVTDFEDDYEFVTPIR